MRATILAFASLYVVGCAAQKAEQANYRWTRFVQVDGQPEPVPVEWVSTPEGKFAHSITIPNPVPKGSGFRSGMTSEEYFNHLCKTEAGDFVFRAVDGIEGFLFMRPPKKPTDSDLMDRFRLEAPDIERLFQLYKNAPGNRSTIFVVPRFRDYRYVEENLGPNIFVKAFGYQRGGNRPKPLVQASARESRFGLTWRGLKRVGDRENAIAGNEWIVVDLIDASVLAVFRNFARTGGVPNATEGIWWLNAVQCPSSRPIFSPADLAGQIYEKLSQVLRPLQGGSQ